MKPQREHRVVTWLAWLCVAALVGAGFGAAMVVVLVSACLLGLTAEEISHQRRSRVYFARLHESALRRHDAVLDRWMEMREEAAARPSARLVDDVTKKPTAQFVTVAGLATDARATARPGQYRTIAAYDEVVGDLEHCWRRLERRARGADALDDARRWGLDRLPDGAAAALTPLVPVVRAAARAAWSAAESRLGAHQQRV